MIKKITNISDQGIICDFGEEVNKDINKNDDIPMKAEGTTNNNLFIGSTTDFVKRKYSHKISCNNEKDKAYNHKKYQYIRDNGGWNCFNMNEIEKYPCNDFWYIIFITYFFSMTILQYPFTSQHVRILTFYPIK